MAQARLEAFQPCDLLIVSTPGIMGALIRFFTRRIGEGPSRCNHIAGVTQAGDYYHALAVEAVNSGIVRRPMQHLFGKGRTVEIWRPLNLTDKQAALIQLYIQSQVGTKYGWGRVIAAAGDWFLMEQPVFRKLCKGAHDCSTLWGSAFAEAGLTFGKDGGVVTPDDIRDFVKGNPQFYQRIA